MVAPAPPEPGRPIAPSSRAAIRRRADTAAAPSSRSASDTTNSSRPKKRRISTTAQAPPTITSARSGSRPGLWTRSASASVTSVRYTSSAAARSSTKWWMRVPVVGGEAELDRRERLERPGQPQPGPHLAEVGHPAPHVVEVGLHDREARHQLLGPGRIVVHPVLLGQAGRAELGRALVVLGGELAGAAAQVDDGEGPIGRVQLGRSRPRKDSRASSSPSRSSRRGARAPRRRVEERRRVAGPSQGGGGEDRQPAALDPVGVQPRRQVGEAGQRRRRPVGVERAGRAEALAQAGHDGQPLPLVALVGDQQPGRRRADVHHADSRCAAEPAELAEPRAGRAGVTDGRSRRAPPAGRPPNGPRGRRHRRGARRSGRAGT